MINHMVEAVYKHGKVIGNDSRAYAHSTKLTLLNEMGALSDHHYRLLNWFQKLRNDCAHEWDFKITAGRLNRFVKAEHRDPGKFDELCMLILLDLWRSYHEPVGP